MGFTFIDLFAGIGGFRLGMEKAGGRCLFSSEINSSCIQTYQKNFSETPFPDVRQVKAEMLPDFDLLCAGFPCQAFSLAGKQLGFNDTRGTLIFDVFRIIKAKNPKVVVLENVKNLIHHDKGNTFKVIKKNLEELGYIVSWKILNAVDFLTPQNRERIIIVATQNKKFDFNEVQTYPRKPLIDFLDSTPGTNLITPDKYTLLENTNTQKSGLVFCGYLNKTIRKNGVRENTEHLSRTHRQPNRIYSALGSHPTLSAQETAGRYYIHIPNQNVVRKLTINECYRIMGFPKDFIKSTTTTEAYRQIGNSVCVNMVSAVAENLVKNLYLI